MATKPRTVEIGWAHYPDGSARNNFGKSGFVAGVVQCQKQYQWTVTLHRKRVGRGVSKTAGDAELAAESVVDRCLSRRRMHMGIYQNLMGRSA